MSYHSTPRGNNAAKALAKQLGVSMKDLLVMAPQNDPMSIGSHAHYRMAEWFLELWHRFGYRDQVHLRRVHYQLVSQENPTMADGRPYLNTQNCWNYLCSAAKYARILGLINPLAFIDNRNPDPQVFINLEFEHEDIGWDISSPYWELPTIRTDLAPEYFYMPRTSVNGYFYDLSDQPIHMEVWVEKSTMDSVLLPICKEYGVTLQTSLGFQSITGIIAMLKRIAKRGKPARIFWIADFDPAGSFMDIAVARQVEYWLENYAPDQEIKLTRLALTLEQVQQYRLPPIPVKESDLRSPGFLARYGVEGQTELDALEAIRPGVLAQLVREAILQYFDTTLQGRLDNQYRTVRRDVEDDWRSITSPHAMRLEDINKRATAIYEKYLPLLTVLASEMEEELAPVREDLQDLHDEVEQEIADFIPELPEREEPDIWLDNVPEDDWLYASERDYLEQLDVYREWKKQSVLDIEDETEEGTDY